MNLPGPLSPDPALDAYKAARDRRQTAVAWIWAGAILVVALLVLVPFGGGALALSVLRVFRL